MNRIRVFLICAFIAGLLLVALAAVYGVGTAGVILYNLGAVIAIAGAILAMTGSWLTDLLKEDDR